MDQDQDAWERYAEACATHDQAEAELALSHLIPDQRTEQADRATVAPRAARSA